MDFFAPILDDPYQFGRVAAANALSDVYAMGGTPVTAMNIVGFPEKALPIDVLTEILRGGQDAVHEAGAHIVGGHTVSDEELKYGLSVTGTVHPDRVLTNANAAPGDRLVLTKALGTGILATAGKQRALSAEAAETLFQSMAALNAKASRAAVALGVRCATDVTGFGLFGHALHIARASGVRLRVHYFSLPLLLGLGDALAMGWSTGGAKRNQAWVSPETDWGDFGEDARKICTDPQTSGGLLVAVPASQVADYLAEVPGAVEIGEVEAWTAGPRLLLR